MKRLHKITISILPLRGKWRYAKVESDIFFDHKKVLIKHKYLVSARDIVIDDLVANGFNIIGYLSDTELITDTIKPINDYV